MIPLETWLNNPALQKALVETITPPSPKATPNWLGRFVEKFRNPIR